MSFSLDKDVNAAKTFADGAANMLNRTISGALSRSALLYFDYAVFDEGNTAKFIKCTTKSSRYRMLIRLMSVAGAHLLVPLAISFVLHSPT